MSGGYYNYLCMKNAHEIFCDRSTDDIIGAMERRLREYGYIAAADATNMCRNFGGITRTYGISK